MRLFKDDFGYNDLSVHTYGDLSEKEFEGAHPLTIFEDNEGCIALSKNPVSHRRSKHIDIRYHWIRERVRAGELKLAKIDTKLNTADIFTKPTCRKTFTFLRDKLMGTREELEPQGTASRVSPDETEAQPVHECMRCMVCGEVGHIESDCPMYKRPDELDERLDPSLRRGHSVPSLGQGTSEHPKGQPVESKRQDDC